MLITYGPGEYIEGSRRFKGRIMLSDHKLYLEGPDGDITATYIPLEKIVRVRRTMIGLAVRIRASMVKDSWALLKGPFRSLSDLTRDLVNKRNFKKRFLWPEWFDESA